MATQIDKTAVIESWLMSCRVFNRGLEYALFDAFMYTVRNRGLQQVQGIFRPTQKNFVVADLYAKLGFQLVEDFGDRHIFVLNVINYIPLSHSINTNYGKI